MKSWFFMREYPENLTSGEMDKIKFSNIERKKSNSKTQKGITLYLSHLVASYLLHMSQEVKRTFTP